MKTVIIVLLAAGILATTNPDSDDFNDHLRERIQDRIEENVDGSKLGSDLSALGADLTVRLAQKVTTRKNYLLFSTYEVLPDEGNDETRWKYLAIAGQFLQLDGPNDDEEN